MLPLPILAPPVPPPPSPPCGARAAQPHRRKARASAMLMSMLTAQMQVHHHPSDVNAPQPCCLLWPQDLMGWGVHCAVGTLARGAGVARRSARARHPDLASSLQMSLSNTSTHSMQTNEREPASKVGCGQRWRDAGGSHKPHPAENCKLPAHTWESSGFNCHVAVTRHKFADICV